jgi:ribosomal protein S27AE
MSNYANTDQLNRICPQCSGEMILNIDEFTCTQCGYSRGVEGWEPKREVNSVLSSPRDRSPIPVPGLPPFILTENQLHRLMKEDCSLDDGLGEQRPSHCRPTSSTLSTSKVPTPVRCPPETQGKFCDFCGAEILGEIHARRVTACPACFRIPAVRRKIEEEGI